MQQMTAVQQKWSDIWDREHTNASDKRFKRYQGYNIGKGWDHDGTREIQIRYMAAINVLKEYSGGSGSYVLPEACAFFNRIGSGQWNTTHGAAVASALLPHMNGTMQPQSETLSGLLNDVKNAVGNVENPNGGLHAILSLFEEKFNLRILGEDNKIIFDPNNPQGQQAFSAAPTPHQ